MRVSLRWKILMSVVTAPFILAAGSLHLVDNRISSNVRASNDDALFRSSLVCQSFLEARSKLLKSSAQVIAGDPRFFAVLAIPVSSRDTHFRATVRAVARDFNTITRADIFEVLDPAGRPVASVGEFKTTTGGRARLTRGLSDSASGPSLLIEDSTLFLVSQAHVRAAGHGVGTLLLGTRVGDDLARELQAMTRSEVSFLTSGRFSGSTLASGVEREALADTMSQRPESWASLLNQGAFTLQQGGTTYLTLVRPMPGRASGDRNVIVLQRSLEGETAYLKRIQRGLAEMGLLTLLAALLVGLLVAHKITHPILRLVRGAGEIETGNYEYPLEIRSRDEIGYLARRFEEMREHERSYIRNLQEAAQLKTRFIDVAAHELRTPTSVILGYTDLLAQGSMGKLTRRQKEALDAIEANTMAIVRIADHATSMAQLEGDRQVLDLEECDVRVLVEEAVEIVRAEAVDRKVAVDVATGDLPLMADADAPRLTQALAHLVRNGVRFTPDDGSVHIDARMDGLTILIEVRDTGVGISPESCENLFDRAHLVGDALHHHSSAGLDFKSTGLGLGLPITRGIVEAHGGSIGVASRLGEGSVFTIRLPAKIPKENPQVA